MYIVQNLVAEHEGSTDVGLAEGGTSRREICIGGHVIFFKLYEMIVLNS